MRDEQRKKKHRTVSLSLSDRLYELFRNKIGKEKGITKDEIIKQLYGTNRSFLENEYEWTHAVTPCLSRLRKRTNCFVICAKKENVFFVLKTKEEQREYQAGREKEILGIEK